MFVNLTKFRLIFRFICQIYYVIINIYYIAKDVYDNICNLILENMKS